MATSWSFNPGAVLGAGLDFVGGIMQMNQQANQFGMQQALAREQMDRDNTRFWDTWNTQNWMADRNENFQREAWGNQFNQALHLMQGDQGFSREMFAANAALQKDFAMNGIQWKVDDARNAGLHPLFALGGGSSFSPSPISVGTSVPSLSASPSGASPGGIGLPGLPSATGGVNPFAGMGQNLTRAIMATQSSEDRSKDALHALSMERGQLENDLLRSRIALVNAQIGRAGMPTGESVPQGQVIVGPLGKYEPDPAQVVTVVPDGIRGPTGTSAGPPGPSRQFVVSGGGLVAMPSKNLQIDEFTSPGGVTWFMDNRVWPQVSMSARKDAKPTAAEFLHHYPNAVDMRFHMGKWYPVYMDEFLRGPRPVGDYTRFKLR